ncbi:MAG: C-GCAxxG-C-C family protein [Bacteroidales bacterium]|nr:C-GCAxxG-C-C family protein [Bacteroidales bacterium]
MDLIKTKKVKLRAKRVFLKKGTCSHAFFYILNREFGHPKPHEERAIDPLAGGILQQGYQCGMLWGASMAVGAESFRRHKDVSKAIGLAIKATQHIMKSFNDRTKCIECEDFTKTDFKNKWSFAKYMFSGKFLSCYKLAENWAPEAIKAAHEGLELDQNDSSQQAISCASEVVRKMGGSEEEMVMVAGFAGGLGLSGSGCGALSASIWKTILELVKKESWKYSMSDPNSEKIIQNFFQETDYKMECNDICGMFFKTIDEHSEFIKNGGCNKLIDILANN